MDKAPRILDIYVRLCEGKAINKKEESVKFGVDERSIQRDIDEIRKYLADRIVDCPGECNSVEYDREQKGFVLVGKKGSLMTNSEILAISKILLESRAFTKEEMHVILDKMIAGCVPEKNMKLVSDLISNEKYHYVALRNNSAIKDKLWEIGEEVKAQNLIEISYRRGGDDGKIVSNILQPLAIVFSEYYFYLIANIVKKSKYGVYTKIYSYPAIYRIDRILEYKEIGETFRVDYSNRFEEGIFRKRIQFMFQGKLMNIQFKYYGGNSEAILDRLPTAIIISEINGVYLVEAEVYGEGILRWLLSLGDMVEVIRPKELREEMKEKINNMRALYKD